MQNTYIDIMIQSLQKKIQVLEEIKRQNILQKSLLEDDKSEVNEFDQTVEAKSALIEQMNQLDSGFEKLFDRVREELTAHPSVHAEKIKTMQRLIRQVTDLSMEIQAQESRNKDLMMRKFQFVKQRAKVVRKNSRVANQYYQNMMQLNVIDPQFMDNKK